MSDAVILSLISTIGTITVAYFAMRTNQKVNKFETKIDDNTKLTNEVKETVAVVKTQTDGMKSELVTVTGLLGEAVGNKAGRAEQKAETEADRLNHVTPENPIKVEVVNEPLQVVAPKDDKDK